ncbi:MAG: hypothetical protein LBU45_08275 [Azoarcus sp.]|nr:hypothetical protein [Azoarcus sp.]
MRESIGIDRQLVSEFDSTRDPDDWADTRNRLGVALRILGERESNRTYLTDAVVNLRAALAEKTRERMPMQWAVIQINPGLAPGVLGERESGTAHLTDAVTAFRNALEVFDANGASSHANEVRKNLF